MTHFGTSAKYIDAIKKSDLKPVKTHDLKELKSMMSTGSPLVPESFDYVYRDIKSDIQLSSVSGGTDIISCFVSGNPILPVRRGELQCLGLGMAVEIYDDQGASVIEENGELVCTKSFPSMPIYFWNDTKNEKYHAAYFERYNGIWCQGDFAMITRWFHVTVKRYFGQCPPRPMMYLYLPGVVLSIYKCAKALIPGEGDESSPDEDDE